MSFAVRVRISSETPRENILVIGQKATKLDGVCNQQTTFHARKDCKEELSRESSLSDILKTSEENENRKNIGK